MALSLKDTNKPLLAAVMALNLAVFYAAAKNGAVFTGDWPALLHGATDLVPGVFGLVIIGILNAQLSGDAKAMLVFGRWHNALPGCRAFTKYGPADSRIDMGAIERAHGPLPQDPQQQNKLWYRLYKSVGADPSVSQAHREFLFARDYACLSLFALILLGTIGFLVMPTKATAYSYLAILGLQYLLTTRAAHVHGCRFVTTVLALKGAGA
jgi:hypothetical protein